MKFHSASALLACGLALASAADAALFYNEAVSGDLSDLGSAPTPVVFGVGVNRVVGTMGGPPDADPDIITFTLLPGQWLTSIYFEPLVPAERSFYAIGAGSTINMSSGTSHLGNTLTYHYGEMLGELSLGGEFGGTGFSIPLGPGTYTAWIQEVSTRVDYDIAYTVIPEPSACAALVGLSGLVLAATRRRRVGSDRRRLASPSCRRVVAP